MTQSIPFEKIDDCRQSKGLPDSPMTFEKFHRLDTAIWSASLVQADPLELDNMGRDLAMRVWQTASTRVPAYRGFLVRHHIKSDHIQEYDDLSQLPVVDKQNYLRQAELVDLAIDGQISDWTSMAVSSGATGEPFFWPRSQSLDAETAAIHELIFREIFNCNSSTLCINGFALGVYIAGLITAGAMHHLQSKGMDLTHLAPGLDHGAQDLCLKQSALGFGQVLMSAYPVNLKSALERAIQSGVHFDDCRMGFFSGGEAFSEPFRDYVLDKVGQKGDLCSYVNIYGSADAAMLGHETPVSTLVRRWAANDPKLCRDLFGSDLPPSVEAYHPYFKHFEADDDGRLIFTTLGGIPLMRYAIGDVGGVWRYDQLTNICSDHGYALSQALADHGCARLDWKLPLVYLTGRPGGMVTYVGLNVYPEPIKVLLAESRWLPHVTGRFVLACENTDQFNQELKVYVELAPHTQDSPELAEALSQAIDDKLQACNREFTTARRDDGHPPAVVELCSAHDPRIHPNTIKPVHTKKQGS